MLRERNFKGAEPWRETLQQPHNSIVELKELPAHLKYAFLEEEKIHPVIISSALDDEQEHSLLSVLRLYKNVIGYSIDDIKGIDEKVCSHRIYLEEDSTPSREGQRRLNPAMQEVEIGRASCRERVYVLV